MGAEVSESSLWVKQFIVTNMTPKRRIHNEENSLFKMRPCFYTYIAHNGQIYRQLLPVLIFSGVTGTDGNAISPPLYRTSPHS